MLRSIMIIEPTLEESLQHASCLDRIFHKLQIKVSIFTTVLQGFETVSYIQRSAKIGAPGLVNFITAVAYHFCPSLPAAFTQPGASTSG